MHLSQLQQYYHAACHSSGHILQKKPHQVAVPCKARLDTKVEFLNKFRQNHFNLQIEKYYYQSNIINSYK